MSPFYESYPKHGKSELLSFLFERQEAPELKPSKYFVACSGGLDSMVLMDLFAEWIRLQRPDPVLVVLHVNYGLRGLESEGDADFVQEQAKLRGLECRLLKVEAGRQAKSGIQDWARQIRYDWFASQCGPQDKVLLAHHEDDLIETILMRVVRGSGLSGLQGMKRLEGLYWRPFLGMSRKDIEEIAGREKILHREDSSNAKLAYSRNRIRKQILPELEGMFPGSGKNLKELARAGQEWSKFYAGIFAQLPEPTTAEAWRSLGFYPAAQWLLTKIRNEWEVKDVGRAWLEMVYQSLIDGVNTVVQLDPHLQVRLSQGQFQLERVKALSSTRWQQYAKELTKTGLSALLSKDSRLATEGTSAVDSEGNEQVNKDVWKL